MDLIVAYDNRHNYGVSTVKDQIANNFKHHAPANRSKIEDHDYIRNKCRNLAEKIDKTCPGSREKSIAITKLEEVMFWANAALARN